MNIKKLALKEKSRYLKSLKKQKLAQKQLFAFNQLRRLDQSISFIKDENQKNPLNSTLVPSNKIHKLMV